MKKISFTIILAILINQLLFSITYTVTNTNDSGNGSLRKAISNCLVNQGAHTIEFNIPTSDPGYDATTGVWTIVFDDALPAITTGYITIDGTTQTQNQGNTNPDGPEICLNGAGNTVEYCFSLLNANSNVIKGLIINEFLYGIQIYGTNGKNNIIIGNYLGTNHDATQRRPNYNAIELISGANHNQIGDSILENRNIISGNDYAGLRISDANFNLVIGNYIGIDRTGSFAVNNYDGIAIEGASASNQIGGNTPEKRNVSSGNTAYGVDIFGAGCEFNVVQGNYIGTDATGSYAIPNTYGLLFDDRSHQNTVGGYNPGEGNVISGNTAFGAYFYNNGTNSNYLIGNMIGTDATGMHAIPNETGVHIDGATYANLVDSNLVSGNLANGITIFATYSDYNIIIRNKIGTDITGEHALSNGFEGIRITQGAANNTIGGSPENANLIAYNYRNGIAIESENADHNLISCNIIHTNGHMSIEIFPEEGLNANDQGDTDTGPNDKLNYPEIQTLEFLNANEAKLSGTVDVQPTSFTKIEIYIGKLNGSGYSECYKYLGSTYADQNTGLWSFTFDYESTDDYYVALTIDGNNNTSEISPEYPDNVNTAINDIEIENDNIVSLFPNPVTNTDYLSIDFNHQNIKQLIVYNALGTVVKSIKVKFESKYNMNISEMSKGVYFIKGVSDDKQIIFNSKFLIQ